MSLYILTNALNTCLYNIIVLNLEACRASRPPSVRVLMSEQIHTYLLWSLCVCMQNVYTSNPVSALHYHILLTIHHSICHTMKSSICTVIYHSEFASIITGVPIHHKSEIQKHIQTTVTTIQSTYF